MKLQIRGGLAAIAIVGSMLVAAGCGGSDSGSTKAAKGSAALDYVPKTALGYVTVDTNFSDDNWTNLGDLAKAFDPEFKPVGDQIAGAAADGDDEVDFEKDVDPWLGDSGGAALLSADMNDSGDADVFAWVEVDDVDALETFAKSQGLEKGSAKVNDFQVWNDPKSDSIVGVKDELAIMAQNRKQFARIVGYTGDSIKDADGVSDAIDGVDGDAIGTLVVSGAGIRAAAKDNAQLKGATDIEQLKDFEALAMSFGAADDGFRVEAMAVSSSDGSAENIKHPIFEDLPSSTVLAVGGGNLGGLVDDTVTGLGKDNAQIQQGVGAISAVLGVDMKDFGKAFDGEFVLGISADDQGLGAIAGGVAGAAMGGGLGGVDPTSVLKAGTVLLAFEESGTASETLDKVAGAAGALTGATSAPKTATMGDFETKSLTLQGVPVTTAASDDVAAVSLGLDVFSDWGSDTLSDNDTFKAAWKAADAPDKSVSVLWIDAGRVATLAGLPGSDDAKLGGLVGWSKDDGKKYEFTAFLHVDQG